MRKREQIQEEKRIHRAQEIERMNSKVQPQGGSDTDIIYSSACIQGYNFIWILNNHYD